ncbi:hypothetical protein [Rhodalgimonas zhirmunskyi]|uniref:Uncharacterized protein n=1 Tax=Rhodalgimonas zhirmunskyi TaxID=2964767 RepID=A0AAJ1UA09_9RHOB|nr:hypothetical protein [Rhodoalgimonas zhirmunskyi]MDQ2093973.1 hypothetical protein [Rhodoalgimonas zhirmunskyi]
MSISHRLMDFGDSRTRESGFSFSEVKLEEVKLEAFERGYKAGWDDANRASADAQGKVSTDLAGNLQELSFTYHEAHAQMLRSLEPFLGQIVASLLPEIAQKALVPKIVEELKALGSDLGAIEAEIVVAPRNSRIVREMLGEAVTFPVRVVEEPSLAEGQAFLRFGESEREINQDNVLAKVVRAVDAFFHEFHQMIEKETRNAG